MRYMPNISRTWPLSLIEIFVVKNCGPLNTEITFLGRALDLGSKDPYVSFERGILHYRAAKEGLGNRSIHLQESRQDIERALALKPGYSLFKKWLATVCNLGGQHQNAADLLKELLPLAFPWDTRLWQLQADVFSGARTKSRSGERLGPSAIFRIRTMIDDNSNVWQLIFAKNPEPVCLLDSESHAIIEVNAAFESLTGYSKAELCQGQVKLDKIAYKARPAKY